MSRFTIYFNPNITNPGWGSLLGTYEGADENEALDKAAQDYGHESLSHRNEVLRATRDNYKAIKVEG